MVSTSSFRSSVKASRRDEAYSKASGCSSVKKAASARMRSPSNSCALLLALFPVLIEICLRPSYSSLRASYMETSFCCWILFFRICLNTKTNTPSARRATAISTSLARRVRICTSCRSSMKRVSWRNSTKSRESESITYFLYASRLSLGRWRLSRTSLRTANVLALYWSDSMLERAANALS